MATKRINGGAGKAGVKAVGGEQVAAAIMRKLDSAIKNTDRAYLQMTDMYQTLDSDIDRLHERIRALEEKGCACGQAKGPGVVAKVVGFVAGLIGKK